MSIMGFHKAYHVMIIHRNLLNQLGFHPVQSGTISYFSMTHSLRIVRLIFLSKHIHTTH